jgi:hypothetical protein
MRIIFCAVLIGAIAIMPESLQARPIAYKGGTMVMQENNAYVNQLNIHYSPTVDWSIGYLGAYWRDKEWLFNGIQADYLIHRFNFPKSQANIYAKAAVGSAYTDRIGLADHWEPATLGGLSADWEDRRFYIAYANEALMAGDIDSSFTQNLRLGIAPYIGDFGDVHTWLMVKLDHRPYDADSFVVTPFVRVFYQEYLAEIGVSDNGKVMANWMVLF